MQVGFFVFEDVLYDLIYWPVLPFGGLVPIPLMVHLEVFPISSKKLFGTLGSVGIEQFIENSEFSALQLFALTFKIFSLSPLLLLLYKLVFRRVDRLLLEGRSFSGGILCIFLLFFLLLPTPSIRLIEYILSQLPP